MAAKEDTGGILETVEKVKTRYRNLRSLKLEEWQVHELSNSRKGYWRTAQMLSVALTNKQIARLGYISMSDYYLKYVKTREPPYTERYVRAV